MNAQINDNFMAHLIDKDALVAEIDRLREVQPLDEFQPKEQNKIDWLSGKLFIINSLDAFLDTLEVKEVNLESEMDKYFETMEVLEHENIFEVTLQRIAKHFFELGLRVNNEKEK